MERLSAKKKVAIVRQYLSGLSYDEVAVKSGVAKGTVANVVVELKAGKFPEAADVVEHIELLRELSLELKRSKLTPEQCAMGLIVLTRIKECGLDPHDIGRWSLILKSAGTEDEAQELVRMIYSIEEVQRKTGLSLDDLDNKVHKLEKKAADLEPMSRQHEDYRKQLAELTMQRDDLANIVANLDEKYKLLNPRVKDLEKREQNLSRRIKDMETRAEKAEATLATLSKERQRLLEVGLSLEALIEFSERVQSIAHRHHIAPAELRDRLLQELENLNQGLGLEEKERAIALARQEWESLKAVVASLKQEKTSLEASIKGTREKVSGEIAKIVPAAMDAVNRLVDELRRGHDEALVEVGRLRDETLEVGKEVGRYEEMLQANQWLTELLAIVQGDEGIEGKRIRVIVLLVLRGAAAWLKQHSSESHTLSSLSYATDSLARELEQWKV